MTDSEKILYRFCLFIILPILFIYAVFFYKERLYGDAGGYLFNMVQFEHFEIAHSRPSSVFIEWLPYILIKLHVPLKYIVFSFSLTEWLYFFTCFILFAYVFKSKPYAIAVIITYLFGIRWNYFNPVSELILAFPFAIFLCWYWQKEKTKTFWWYVISLSVSVFLILSHTLYVIVIPTLFALIHYSTLFTKRNITFAIGFLGITVMAMLLLDGYEKKVISGDSTSQEWQIAKAISRLLNKTTLWYFIKAYAGQLFLLSVLSLYLIKNKKIVQPIILYGFVSAYFLFLWLSFNENYPNTFEPFERYLFITALISASFAAPYITKLPKWQSYTLATLLLWHIIYLGAYGLFVKERYAVFNMAIENSKQFKANKVLYQVENYYYNNHDYQGHNWTMLYESLLFTASNSPDSTRQVYVRDVISDNLLNSELREDDYLFANGDWLGRITDLNQHYFRMQTSPWLIANSDSTQCKIDSIAPKIRVTLDYDKTIRPKQERLWNVTITNPTGIPIYSGTKNQYRAIGYNWKNTSTGKIEKGTYSTRFMCDVLTQVKQKIELFGPETAGSYELQLGYVSSTPDTFFSFSTKEPIIIEVK